MRMIQWCENGFVCIVPLIKQLYIDDYINYCDGKKTNAQNAGLFRVNQPIILKQFHML